MAKDVDLSSQEWRDLVFEGKNKEFGAYEMRTDSPKRHNWAMLAVVLFIGLAFLSAFLVDQFAPAEEEVTTDQDQDISALIEEAPEEEVEEVEDLTIPEPEIPEVIEEELLNTEKVTEIVIVDDKDVKEPPKSQEELQQSTTAAGLVNEDRGTDDIVNAKIHEEVVVVEEKPVEKHDDNKVFDSVEQDPQFPGGQEALLKWISNNIRYPSVAQENGIQGKVTVQFVVTKTGSIGQVKVVRGKDPDLDKEAVRVVKSLPKFTPGKMNGHPVNVWYTLPITFRLQGV